MISRFFIERPILANVIAILFVLIGVVSMIGLPVARGWITLFVILLKGTLAVSAALLLIATTGMNRLAAAMRSLRVPRLFVTVFFLTFRYIGVLGEELARVLRAYDLRAPGQRGITPRAWGSLLGQMLLRAFARAERIHAAMTVRGFRGEYPLGGARNFSLPDLAWLLAWLGFFLFCRLVDIPAAIGALAGT